MNEKGRHAITARPPLTNISLSVDVAFVSLSYERYIRLATPTAHFRLNGFLLRHSIDPPARAASAAAIRASGDTPEQNATISVALSERQHFQWRSSTKKSKVGSCLRDPSSH